MRGCSARLVVAVALVLATVGIGACAEGSAQTRRDPPPQERGSAPPSQAANANAPAVAEPVTLRFVLPASARDASQSAAAAALAPVLQARAESDAHVEVHAALHCAATALAEMEGTAQGARPSLRVRRFIASSCGAFAADLDAIYFVSDAAPGSDAGDLAEGFAPAIQSKLAAVRFEGPVHVGIGAALTGGQFVVVIAQTRRFAQLAPGGAQGHYTLSADAQAPAYVRLRDAEVLAARPEDATDRCTTALSENERQVDVACPNAGGTWIIAGVQPHDWLVGQPLGATFVPAGPGDDGAYTRLMPAVPETPEGLTTWTNRARAGADLTPLALAAAAPLADEKARALMSMLEKGVLPTDPDLAAVLQWWLDGRVLDAPSDMGYVGWSVVQASEPEGELWGTVLEFPDTKSVLFHPDTDVLVVSSVLPLGESRKGVVYATYARADDEALFARVERALHAARALQGGTWAVWTDGPNVLATARAAFGDEAQKRAELVRLATAHGDANTAWYVLEATQVSLLTVPEALAAAPSLDVALFVTRSDDRAANRRGVQVWVAAHPGASTPGE